MIYHLGSAMSIHCLTRPQYVERSYLDAGRSRPPGIEADITGTFVSSATSYSSILKTRRAERSDRGRRLSRTRAKRHTRKTSLRSKRALLTKQRRTMQNKSNARLLARNCQCDSNAQQRTESETLLNKKHEMTTTNGGRNKSER